MKLRIPTLIATGALVLAGCTATPTTSTSSTSTSRPSTPTTTKSGSEFLSAARILFADDLTNYPESEWLAYGQRVCAAFDRGATVTDLYNDLDDKSDESIDAHAAIAATAVTFLCPRPRNEL